MTSVKEPHLSTAAQTPARRIVERLRQLILEGDLQAGRKLPSVRQLSRDWGVSTNTVTAALGVLEAEGLVIRSQRHGVFAHRPDAARRKLPVGLIMADCVLDASGDGWGNHVVVGCLEQLSRRGLRPEVIRVGGQGHTSWDAVQRLLRGRREELGGAIVTWSACDEQTLKDFVNETGLPVIKIGRSSHHCRHNVVSIDHFGAGRLAAERVLDRLPGPFLMISGAAPHDFPRRQLCDGFMDRLQEARPGYIRFDVVCVEGIDLEVGRQAMRRYLAEHGVPRCVFTVGDLIAIGAMDEAMAQGLRVPEDIAFIGSAGLDACRVCKPTLAHIQQPMEHLGAAAVELLDKMYDMQQVWRAGRELPVIWVPGGSLAQGA